MHISPGAHLAGTVAVGDYSWICVGVSVVNNVTIEDDVVIGAGAIVLKRIDDPGVYIGIPAKKLER